MHVLYIIQIRPRYPDTVIGTWNFSACKKISQVKPSFWHWALPFREVKRQRTWETTEQAEKPSVRRSQCGTVKAFLLTIYLVIVHILLYSPPASLTLALFTICLTLV